ncbi:MAG: hypothetical protein P8170_21125 [Gemmatimonadota bacterium]
MRDLGDHLLAVAAFEPEKLQAVIQEIAALSATEAKHGMFRTRKQELEPETEAKPLDLPDPSGWSDPPRDPELTREDGIERLVGEYGIEPREAAILYATEVLEEKQKDVAQEHGLSEGRISQILGPGWPAMPGGRPRS